jgi:mRNA interferase MazF
VWLIDLGVPAGHEQGGRRPALIVSPDQFNHGALGLVLAVPITTTDRGYAIHVAVEPPEGGLRERSFVMCEQVRSTSHDRLIEPWGRVRPETLRQVVMRLRLLTPAP